MRTDGVHRVVLNTPVFKGMKFGTPEGGEPTGKTINITGMEGGKPALFILKVSAIPVIYAFLRVERCMRLTEPQIGKEDVVKDLYHKIQDLQDDL